MCSHGYHASPDGTKCVGESYLLNMCEMDWTILRVAIDGIDDALVWVMTQYILVFTKCHKRKDCTCLIYQRRVTYIDTKSYKIE